MMAFFLRSLMAMLALSLAAAAQAQGLPPVIGSTSEFQAADKMTRAENMNAWLKLMLAACQKRDAGGCYSLSEIDEARLRASPDMPPSAQPQLFADQSLDLARQRCAPEKGVVDACATYRVFLSNMQFAGKGGPRILEGGRLLAKLCLAGKGSASECSSIEKLLADAPAEREMLAAWVDRQFEAGCASGDTQTCHDGFFRKWAGGVTAETWPRFARLVEASVTGCNASAPQVCGEAADFLAKFGGKENYPLLADLFARACKLPPRAGEDDVREAACKNEGIVRAAIAKDAPPR